MTNRSLLLAACAAASMLFVAPAALAAPGDLYGSTSVGATDTDTSNLGVLDPSGTTATLTAGIVAYDNGGLSVAVETSTVLGDVSASRKVQTCDVVNCGFDEWLTETDQLDWTIDVGLSASHPVGDFVVTAGAGLSVSAYSQKQHYTSAGAFPDYTWNSTQYGVGYYWSLGVDYPLSDLWSLSLKYRQSDQTVDEWSSTYSGNADGLDIKTWSLGAKYRF